jgi:hypothetical protein
MVKIAISQEAFDAIAGAMPVESVANERGERLIWLPRGVVAKLRAMRGLFQRDLEACGRRDRGSVKLTRICAPRQTLRGGGAEQRIIPVFLVKRRKAIETQAHPAP